MAGLGAETARPLSPSITLNQSRDARFAELMVKPTEAIRLLVLTARQGASTNLRAILYEARKTHGRWRIA